jgi:hypothetical protein
MKRTDYFLLGLFFAAIFAALIVLRSVPCSPIKAFGHDSADGDKATACKGLRVIEF